MNQEKAEGEKGRQKRPFYRYAIGLNLTIKAEEKRKR